MRNQDDIEAKSMTEQKIGYLRLHPRDNIAVAVRPLPLGESVEGIRIPAPVAAGHKLALSAIAAGQPVIKFGFPIGVAATAIQPGEHVHSHNVTTSLGAMEYPHWNDSAADRDGVVDSGTKATALGSPGATFWGYRRADGRVAARNEIWIINTVACVNQTAARLAERANRELLPQFSHIDGFQAFPHPYGCSQLGDDLAMTQRVLSGLINHPHAGAVLLLGLGCENNRMAEQLKSVHPEKMSQVIFFNTQEVGDELSEGQEALAKLAGLANEPRQIIPASELILGMKCGGSDGFSGITANPLLGRIADWHCAQGGTVLLTEVPEMFGAEAVLLDRCADADVHGQLIKMVEEFKDYFRSHNQPISENPSPGNKDGGITTLEEKSLGCVQKAGTQGVIRQIVEYGGHAASRLAGIALVNGPGNDGVSITNLATAGANVVLFTTGRGTPMGAPVPTMKVASNSELAAAKPAWIDFDAGRVLSGESDFDQLAHELYEQLLRTASGELLAKNELNGYREIAIWKTGVTL